MTDKQDDAQAATPEEPQAASPEAAGDATAGDGGQGEGRTEEEVQNRYQGLITHLRRIDTFRHFSDHDLANQFLPASKVLTFQAGEIVLKEGELDSWVYFLISGQMKVVKRGVILNQFGRQGDVFGEISAIDGTPRSATVMSVKKSTCLAFDLGRVDNLDPAARDAFLSILYRVFAIKLAERLREAGAKIVQLEEALARLRPKG